MRNSIFMFLSLLVRLLTGVGIFVVLARAWGVQRFGGFMFPYVATTLVALVVDYGFNLQIVRDLGRQPARMGSLLSRTLGAKFLLSILVTSVSLVVFATGPTGPDYWPEYGLLLTAAILNSFGVFLNLPLRSIGRFELETIASVAGNATLLVISLAIALAGGGGIAVAAAFLVARAVYVTLAWRILNRSIPGIAWEWPRWRDVLDTLRSGLPFGVHTAVAGLYFQADTLVVQKILGAHAVGLYQAGVRILVAGLILSDVLANVYLPRMARHGQSRDELRNQMGQLVRYGFLIGGLGLVVTGFLLPVVVPAIYGPGYSDLATMLPWFGCVLMLRYMGVAWALMLTVADRQGLRAIAVVLALLINLSLNAMLLPVYGVMGALYASMGTHVALNLIYLLFALRSSHGVGLTARSLGILFLDGLAATILALGFPSPGLWPLAGALMLALVWVGVEPAEWWAMASRLASRWRLMVGKGRA